MAGLGQFGAWRHIVVGASIGAVALAVGTGLVGRDNGEHFDSKQVVVSPAGDTALHLHEVVDMDFGHQSRHGYQRIVPNDFGVPTKVVATATDAPDDVSVTEYTSTTQIRVGDPNVTVSGQHRYTLDYVLPAVDFSVPGSTDPAARQLALDIIGTDETLRTDTFEVVVTGFELADPLCNVGGPGAVRGLRARRRRRGVPGRDRPVGARRGDHHRRHDRRQPSRGRASRHRRCRARHPTGGRRSPPAPPPSVSPPAWAPTPGPGARAATRSRRAGRPTRPTACRPRPVTG